MAEPTKVKIYNFGDRKLDYGKYITNLENNVESYLQNLKDTEGWDDNRIQEFRNSFGEILSNFRNDYQGEGTRFSTNQLGAIVDTLGILNDTDSDDFFYNKKGEQIDRTKYDALKDRKKRRYSAFEANREVAEYFRRIGSYMKDYEDTTEKFDLSKHGFNKWLMDREAPGGTFNYQNYWDLDPVDAKTGKRGTTQRVAQAKKWIDDYITEMKGRNDLNFEGNKSFTSLEDYLKKAQSVADQWGNPTWDANDRIAAQRLGIDNDFMTKFFGTEGTPDNTPQENAEAAALRAQQAKEEEEKKSTEAKEKEYKAWVDSQYNDYVNKNYRYTKQVPYYTNLYSWDKYYKDGNLTDEYHKMLGNLVVTHNGSRKAIMLMNDKEKGEVLGSLLTQYVDRLYDPKFNIGNIPLNNHYMYLLLLITQHYAQDLGDGTYYIPSTKPSNSALIFDLNGKTLYHTFIGDIPSIWDLRKQEYYNKVNGVSASSQYYEEGGVIKAQDGAALLRASASKYFSDRAQYQQEQLLNRATAKGRTVEQLTAAERPLSEGFSTADKARIAGALADIGALASAFTTNPVGVAASGILGLGSTGANLFADIKDDSVSAGQATKNTIANLGFDLLGMIPYLGAEGKIMKIVHRIGHLGAKGAMIYGTIMGAQAMPEVINSLNKLTKDPSSLTAEDWQYIAQGFGTIMGGGTVATRYARNTGMRQGTRTDLGVIQVRNKRTGKVENKVVGKKTAADLRAAANNQEMQLILFRDNPWMNGQYEIVNNGGLFSGFSWKKPTKNDKKVFTFGDRKAKVYEVRRALGRDNKPGSLYGYRGKWKSDLAVYDNPHLTVFGRHTPQSYKPNYRGTMLPDERSSYLYDLNRLRSQVGTPENKNGVRRIPNDEDFRVAYEESRTDLDNTPNKSTLIQQLKDLRKYYEEQLKPFRDQHGSTGDITNRLNASRTLKNSPDYQTAVGQHATLTQQHADLVARHQPMIDSYKQQIRLIDNDLVFYNDLRTSANPKDRAFANREIKRLTKLRQQLQTEHDTLSAELLASETKVKDNQARIDAGSDTRIQELEALENQSKAHDETLANIDKEISRLEQLGGAHTPSYLELMNKRVKDGKITFTDERGQQFTVDAVRAMRLAGIKKNGGILDAVEKFLNSGKIKSPMRDVQNPGNVSWYQDMFVNGLNAIKKDDNEQVLPNWFDKWKIDDPIYNPDKFNQLLTDWYNNLQATGYLEGSNKAVRNPGVEKRQPDWEATGGNAPIGEMLTSGRLVGNGGTEDKPDENGKFGTDGVFGQQEFLRHAGRWGDWKDRPNELAEFNKKLAERGLVYEKDRSKDTDMMMLYPLDKQPEKPSEPEKPATKTTYVNLPGGKKEKLEPDKSNKFNNLYAKARQLFGDPDLIANTRLFNTLSQIDRERDLDKKKLPYLKEVPSPHLYVRKDFMALQNARKAQGMLMHMASQPITPDGNQWLSYYADQFTKMLDYGIQGNQLADAKLWETTDASKANEINNLKERVQNRNDNMATLVEKQHNDITSEEVADYKKTTAINNRLYELLARNEQKRLDAEDAQKRADAMLLDNDITFNLSKYSEQFGITKEEVDVWNKVQSGTAPSKLSSEELKLWESVYRKVNYGKGLLTAQQSGADISGFAQVRSMVTKPSQPSSPTAYNPNAPSWGKFKEGGKVAAKSRIKVAKIRERIKNADRAARAAEKNLDRVQKTVESINKRMYGVKR